MDKSNLELFKQALNEAVSNKFDKMADECTEEIVCSERHKLAMRTIIYGKADTSRAWSPRVKRIIAILVAAALILTSCGIIFRNQIREIFEEFYVKLTYDGNEESNKNIDEVYVLGYVPEGYVLENEVLSTTYVKYKFMTSEGDVLYFEQRALTNSEYYIDSESGYSKIEEIEEFDVYYRFTNKFYHYVWNNETYTMTIKSSIKLSNENIILLINEITTK